MYDRKIPPSQPKNLTFEAITNKLGLAKRKEDRPVVEYESESDDYSMEDGSSTETADCRPKRFIYRVDVTISEVDAESDDDTPEKCSEELVSSFSLNIALYLDHANLKFNC